MICKVEKTIEKYGLLSNVRTVCVGVSGGADSMCILDILSSLKDKYGIILKVVHVNHNLRGDEAKRDEDFVRTYCEKNGVELTVFSEDIASTAKQMKIGEEECGRIVRYLCFEKMNCDAIAVAHTLSDSIETLFFNLARGTALKGLCGIPAKREPNIIRPLIECTRIEIEDYCDTHNVPYIVDSSNLSDDYMRNHIRHNLIPNIQYINEAFEKNIARCVNSLSEDEDFLSSQANKLVELSRTQNGYNNTVLKNAHSAVRKRALAYILKDKMNKSVENKHIELFNEIVMQSCGKLEVAADLYISVKGDIIFFHGAEKTDFVWKSVFENNKAVTPYGDYYISSADLNCENAIDSEKITGELVLSSRQSGDNFTFKQRGITKSLKKLFNEMKIPPEKRNAIPVLHDGEKVVWIENIGVNEFYKPDQNSKNIIIIKREG